jgi:protein translocase SecG subunit
MELNTIFKYAEAVVAFLLAISILLQNRNGGLGTVFGGSSGGESYRSRRGLEAMLYNSTLVLGFLFALLAIAIAITNA